MVYCLIISFIDETTNEEIEYSLVFGENVNEMVKIGREIRKRLKFKEKLMDNG